MSTVAVEAPQPAPPRRAAAPTAGRSLPVTAPGNPFEHEADRVAARIVGAPAPVGLLQRACACGGTPGPDGECAACKARRLALERSAVEPGPAYAPPVVHEVLASAGRPLDPQTRGHFGPRLGIDLDGVRVHDDARAAESAAAVDAHAYTVGDDVVFAAGRYRPGDGEGRHLLAHELAHVAQARRGGAPAVRRTPARKVSCAPGPLHVPAATPFDVADPVAVITDAETEANRMLDLAIDVLDFTRRQILGGAPIGSPTIGDNLGFALRVLGLDPESDHFWRGTGPHTAALLLLRLRLVRGTIGGGGFFFICLGPATGTLGACVGPICNGANAASCGGSFMIALCTPFWSEDADAQAETLMHESFHNFANFIQDQAREREGIAGCYSRFVQIAAGVDESHQRADLCGDP